MSLALHSKNNSEIVKKEKKRKVPHSVVSNSPTDEISHNEDENFLNQEMTQGNQFHLTMTY